MKEFPSAIGSYKTAVEESGTATAGFQDETERMQPVLTKLGEAFKGLKESTYVAIGPAVETLAADLTNLIKSVTQSGTFASDMKSMGDSLAALATSIANSDIVKWLGDVGTALNLIITAQAWVQQHGIAGMKGMASSSGTTGEWGAPTSEGATGSWGSTTGNAGGGASGAAGGLSGAMGIAQGWENVQIAQQQEIANDQLAIASAQQTFAQRVALYTQEAADKQITEQQKFQFIQAALAQELGAETQAMNDELSLDQQSVQAKDAEEKAKQAIVAAATLKMTETNSQSIQQQQAMWMQYTNFVTSQMQGMLQSMLQGTLNWQTETRKLMQDLILFFAGIVENFGRRGPLSTPRHVANLTATQATNLSLQATAAATALDTMGWQTTVTAGQVAASTTQAAAQQTGAATGMLAIIANAMSAIGASVAQAYAGITAFLAPVLGPAAPAAAAGEAAGIEATSLGFMAFDTGAWNLPSGLVAQLHAGEMVVPANFAEGLRQSGGFGGGGTTHIHLHNAIGTREWFEANGDYIAGAIQQQSRNFNRNLRIR